MFDLDNWQEIYSSVKKHKLRTLLTAFGVFWGILMLVLLLGAGKGLENGVFQMFGNNARNTIFIWSEVTRLPYKGLSPGRKIAFDNADYQAIRRQVPDIAYLVPNLNLGEKISMGYKEKSVSFLLKGTHPDLRHIKAIDISDGRFLNMLDMNEQRKVAVIGRRIRQILFNNEDPTGKFINIKGVYFKVIGTFLTDETGNQKEDAETVLVPLSTLQHTFGYGDDISLFTLTPKSGVPAEKVESKLKQLLSARHAIHPQDQEAISSFNSEREFNKFVSLFTGINLFIWIVGSGTIIAGIIGVGNIMLIIVKERTREIGVRKALGATPFSIVSLIIMESVIITSAAGYVGLLAGIAIVESVRNFLDKAGIKSEFFKDPHIDTQVALTAVLILVVTGAIAGLIPARNAANIHPIEALKTE
jgi:putative ABC transport system permease protein